MSKRFERRIRELEIVQMDYDGDVPLREDSIEAAREFLNEPLVTAGPNGDIYLDWHWPDGATLCIQFREGQSPNWAGRPNRKERDDDDEKKN